VAVVGLSLFFVVIVQKDLGSGLPILAIALAVLFSAGVSKKIMVFVLVAVLVLGVGAILTSEHRRERVATFFGAESSEMAEDADSYHIDNALIAIGTGGMFGVGVGNSVQATGYLPESINDSVFAIIGETFGFIGVLLVLTIFMVLLLRILKVADCSVDREKSLAAVGVFAWIATQTVVNVAAMTGLIPLTGITLPLLSYGGTSMLTLAAGLGLVMQISMYTSRTEILDSEREVKKDDFVETGEYQYRRRRV